MPCQGPSEEELRRMQMEDNLRIYGVKDTYETITTRVACHLARGESNDLTKKWIQVHDELDARRNKEYEERTKREAMEKEIALATKAIKKKYRGAK